MKNKIITSLIAAVAMVMAAPSADAQRHHRHHHHHGHHDRTIFVSGYHPCGTPIYSERYIVRYDRYHRPIYAVRVVRHHPHAARPFVRGHYAPRGYHVPPTVCPPPHHRGTAIRIRF